MNCFLVMHFRPGCVIFFINVIVIYKRIKLFACSKCLQDFKEKTYVKTPVVKKKIPSEAESCVRPFLYMQDNVQFEPTSNALCTGNKEYMEQVPLGGSQQCRQGNI